MTAWKDTDIWEEITERKPNVMTQTTLLHSQVAQLVEAAPRKEREGYLRFHSMWVQIPS